MYSCSYFNCSCFVAVVVVVVVVVVDEDDVVFRKVFNSNTCVSGAIFKEMEQKENNWLMRVKQELDQLDINYVWNLTNVDKNGYNVITERISDAFK